MNEQFGLLYATPSFLDGVARATDIGDTLTEYNDSESAELADRRALRSDWKAIGGDLRTAISRFRRDQAPPLSNE